MSLVQNKLDGVFFLFYAGVLKINNDDELRRRVTQIIKFLSHFLSSPLVRPLVLVVDSAKVAHDNLRRPIYISPMYFHPQHSYIELELYPTIYVSPMCYHSRHSYIELELYPNFHMFMLTLHIING